MTEPLAINLPRTELRDGRRALAPDGLVRMKVSVLAEMLDDHSKRAAEIALDEYHGAVINQLRAAYQAGFEAGRRGGTASAAAADFSAVVEALDRQTAAIAAPRRTIKDLVANDDGEIEKVMELTLTDLPDAAA